MSAIRGVDSLAGAASVTGAAREKETQGAAKDMFSAILQQMQTGGASAGSSGGESEKTTTVTQVMADGSVLVTVYEGEKIVSQTKMRAANPEENPTIQSTQSGQSAVSAAGTAELMLRMLG